MSDTSNKEAELNDALLRMIRVASKNHTNIEGVATNIDEVEYTCDVVVNDGVDQATIAGVPLEVMTGSPASVLLIPNEGSNVLVCFRDGHQDRPQLFKVHSVKKVIINPTAAIQLMLGENGGLVLVGPLTERLNVVESDLNKLKAAFNSWDPVPNDGGAALKAASAQWAAQEIELTKETDIENENISQ